MKNDYRSKKVKVNKCKACQYYKRVDRWRFVCSHPCYEKCSGGVSEYKGVSTIACKEFTPWF